MWPRNVGVAAAASRKPKSARGHGGEDAGRAKRRGDNARALQGSSSSSSSSSRSGQKKFGEKQVEQKAYRPAPPPKHNPWGVATSRNAVSNPWGPVSGRSPAAASLAPPPAAPTAKGGNSAQRASVKRGTSSVAAYASAAKGSKSERAGKPAPTRLDEVSLLSFIKKPQASRQGKSTRKSRALQSHRLHCQEKQRARLQCRIPTFSIHLPQIWFAGAKRATPNLAKKKEISTLKKIILRERTERHQLAHPETVRAPLVVHASCHGTELTKLNDEAEKNGGGDGSQYPSPTVVSPVFWGYAHAPMESVVAAVQGDRPPKVLSQKRARGYVNQALSKKLDGFVIELLKVLSYYQKRARQSGGMGKKKKRLVMGLREVHRGVRSRKVKCVIVAPNIEQSFRSGGIDDRVAAIIEGCAEGVDQDGVPVDAIPVVFALNRRRLAKAVGKRQVGVSVVGVYDADGAYEHYRPMIKLAAKLRNHFAKVATKAGGAHAESGAPACLSCHATLTAERYDCMRCGDVRCSKCCNSALARRVPCAVAAADDDAESKMCEYAMVVCISSDGSGGEKQQRGKPLSVEAAAFVPSSSTSLSVF